MSIKPVLIALWRFLVLTVVLLSAVGVTISFTPVSRATNCGGNSAALSKVRMLSIFASLTAMESPDDICNFTRLSVPDAQHLQTIAISSWNRTAKFYVAAGDITPSAMPPRLVTVCGTPYRNVPERRLGAWSWPAPPTHAAAYTDGTTALLTPTEYASIDLAAFLDVANLPQPVAAEE